MEADRLSELLVEVESLKQFLSLSRGKIRKLARQAGQDGFDSDGQPSDAEKLLNLIDDILSLQFTVGLQITISSTPTPTSDSHVVDGDDHPGVEMYEETGSSPSAVDDVAITEQPDEVEAEINEFDDMEADLLNELLAEVESLKQFLYPSLEIIREIARQAGLAGFDFDGRPSDVEKLVNRIDDILSLPFMEQLVVVDTSESPLQDYISDQLKNGPTNDSQVVDGDSDSDLANGGVEEMSSDDEDVDQFYDAEEGGVGITNNDVNLDSGATLMKSPNLQMPAQIPKNRPKKAATKPKAKNRSKACKTKQPLTPHEVLCELCGEILKHQSSLSAHMIRQHTNRREGPSCDICHRVFCSPTNLQRHIKDIHSARGRRPRFPCTFPGCEKTFLNKISVTRHFAAEHAPNPVRLPCTRCTKEFKTWTSLKYHVLSHTTERPHKCATCGRGFVEASNLKKHEATHLDKSKRNIHKCRLCPHTSLRKGDLERHVRVVHKNQKNYSCTFCDKRCTNSSNLKRHLEARHPTSKEAIHSCDRCEYKSHSKHYLAIHKTRHDAGKHTCYFCGKKFVTFRELVQHMGRMHTLEK